MMKRVLLAGIAALVVTSAAAAQERAAPMAKPDLDAIMRADVAARRDTYAKMPDTKGTGQYPAEKATDPAFPGHVVYHPIDMSALGERKLPVLVWGNGGCSDDGAGARLFLAEIASHGYLVVAPGAIRSGPGASAPAAAPSTKLGVKTTSEDVRAGIDLAARANAAPGAWHDRIDLSRVAVAGTSCGGLQALQLAGDPRIKAVVVLHSGIFADGSNPIEGMTVDKSLLETLHTPVLYILGGPLDVAYPNGTDDVKRIGTVPVFLADHPVRHLGTFAQPNGGSEARVTADWLDWQLLGNAKAGRQFTGADCGLCKSSEWTVVRKGID
jgi:dienelactone hydrolase